MTDSSLKPLGMPALVVYPEPNKASMKSDKCVFLHNMSAIQDQRQDKHTGFAFKSLTEGKLSVDVIKNINWSRLFFSSNASRVAEHHDCVIRSMLKRNRREVGRG